MEITIFTAKFVRFEVIDGVEKAIIDVRLSKDIVQRRAFDTILVEGIKPLNKLLISIKTEPGSVVTTFINGNRYWKLFRDVGWPDERIKRLTKDIDPYGEEDWT